MAGPTRMGMLQSIQMGAVSMEAAPSALKLCMLKAEVMETLLYT